MIKKHRKVGGIKENEYGEFEVRLTHDGNRRPIVNYTRKYKCKTLEETENKVLEFKSMLDRGEDPFDKRTFGDYMDEYFDKLIKRGTKSGKIYQSVYNKYAKNVLHYLQPDKIQKAHIEFVYHNMIDKKNHKGEYEINSSKSLTKMRTILSPTFKYLVEDKKMPKNNLKLVDIPSLERHKELSSLNIRLKDQKYIDVVRKLYKGIQKIEKDDIRNYLLFTLMTMRRRSETYSIEQSHIQGDIINATKNITKTKISESFPIPPEIVPYIKTSEKKYLLHCDMHDYGKAWRDVLKDQHIDYVQDFRVRDTRNLFMSIMQKKYNRELVGACISHHKGDINEIYTSYEFEDRKEIFEAYWELLRGATKNI